ncbi:MAG TPA: ABC transporter permease [Trueperaceae bacterium]
MSGNLLDIGRVARRVLLQLLKDPRFLVLACLVPVLLVWLLQALFTGVPSFQRLPIPWDEYALPAAAFFIFFLTYLLATIVLVRERNTGTLVRMLAVGYSRSAIVLGYVLGYATLAAVQTLLVVVAALVAFDVPLQGSLLAVVATTLTLSIVSLALGVFVSTLARTEGQIFPTIPLLIVPSMLLSGLIIPLSQLPGYLRALAYVVPLTYAEDVLLGMLRDGQTFAEVFPSFLILLAFGVALLAVSTLTVRARD